MKLNSSTKFFLDLIPAVAFFAAYKLYNLYVATGVLLAFTLITLVIIYVAERRLALAPLITAIIVAIFGGLTLYLHDENFIKMKPTLVYLLFAAILLGGCFLRKGLLKHVLGLALNLTPEGWYYLSRRWGIFFLFMAGLNEIIRRNFTTSQWVTFKVFGALGLTLLFALLQTSFIQKYMEKDQ